MAESVLYQARPGLPALRQMQQPFHTQARNKNMADLVLTVKNDSSHVLFISGDPNWDDQVLTIDGTPQDQPFTLSVGSSASVTAGYTEMGVMFSTVPDYDSGPAYQLSIGPDPDTGNASVTDGNSWGPPPMKYTLSDQTPLSATMTFVDDNG
jgi:hypothetical protein